jgi:hypothetical protein
MLLLRAAEFLHHFGDLFFRFEPTRARFSLILRMILSEKSATPAFAGASFFGIMR